MWRLALITVTSLALLAWILSHTPVAEAGQIIVTVQDFDGNPLPNANVTLQNSTGSYSDMTDSGGRAVLNDMKVNDRYTLTVKYLGIEVRIFNDWNYSNTYHPKTFKTGVFNTRVCALTSGGRPVPGAAIEVRSDMTSPSITREVVAGGDGCVTFYRLPGNGTMYVLNASYIHSGLGVKVEGEERIINLSENNYKDLSVKLPLYRLRLTLRDRGGEAVPGLSVSLWRDDEQRRISTTSGSNGVAAFDLLPVGRYYYEVSFRGEEVYSPGSAVRVDGDRDLGVDLPLTRLVVEVLDLKSKPLASYTRPPVLAATLYVGATVYLEATGGGVISLGHVYDERDYILILSFEGQEVFSGPITSEEVRGGRVRVQARFGDFTLVLEGSGLFGDLRRIMIQRASITLTVGDYEVSGSFRGTESVTLRDQPLVAYTYVLVMDGLEVGSGELTPRHGEASTVTPALYTLSVRVSSLDGRPVAGAISLYYSGGEIGSLDIPKDGGAVKGLLALNYRYAFNYRGVVVASGELVRDDVIAGEIRIPAAVGDVRVRVLDNAGVEPLGGALASLSAASYREDALVDHEGFASFPDAPLTSATVTIYFHGVKVYSAPIALTPEQRSIEIRGTGVYTLTFAVHDGEGEPLTGTELRISVGELSITERLEVSNELTLKLIPNGTLTVSVSYMGVNVYSGIHRPLRYGEKVELKVKTYGLQVQVYYRGREGSEPLSGALLVFNRDEGRLLEVEAAAGSAALKLPAGNYRIQVYYKGVQVADRIITLTGVQKLAVETTVYRVSFIVLGLDGVPIANASLKLTSQGRLAEELVTGADGTASAVLPEGIYEARYGVGGFFASARLPVNSASGWVLLYGDDRGRGLAPILAAPPLTAIAFYGMYKSLKVKARPGAPSGENAGARRGSSWAQRSRPRLKRNV